MFLYACVIEYLLQTIFEIIEIIEIIELSVCTIYVKIILFVS